MQSLLLFRETLFEKITRHIGLYVLAPLLMILTLPVVMQIPTAPDFGFSVHNLNVVAVVPHGSADVAGLKSGDLIREANGSTVTDMPEWYAALAQPRELPGLPLVVERDGLRLPVRLQPNLPNQAKLIRSYSIWVVGLSFLLIGWWVLFRKRDPVARNFFSQCLIFAFFLLDIPDLPQPTYMLAKDLLRDLLQLLLPAFFLRFFLQFPVLHPGRRGRPNQLRVLLAPGLFLFLCTVLILFLHPDPVGSTALPILEIAAMVYSLGYFIAGLGVFARRAMRRDRPIQRTKMMVILVGLVAGLLPFLVAMILGKAAPDSALPHWQYMAFSLLLVPASFGLAIMRYGALDKGFVVRTSLIYGLVTLLVLAIFFLVVVGLGHLLARLFNVSPYSLLLIVLAATSLAIMPLRNLIQRWIDRTFYPDRRADRQDMDDLAEELTGLIDSHEVVDTLMRRLHRIFRPVSLTLFLAPSAAGGDFRQAGTLGLAGDTSPSDTTLQAASSLVVLLDRLRRPVFTEELESLIFTTDGDPTSLRLLTRLKVVLLVPLVTGNRLLGFFLLGAKTRTDIYSQDDLANLRSLAMQAATLVESRRLYNETLQQKKLETELEVAREIQSRLLPDGPVETDAFFIAGRNEPSQAVGGDYYDYFLRPDGCLALVIADVAGKGIPAALLMSSIRTAFRTEAESGHPPTAVINRLNSLFADSAAAGQFVCFFFGVLDPQTGLLSYCNAGMDPPVLFRSRTGIKQYLRKGGPVLGVDPDFAYREGALAMVKGDRLFCYTDGMTEERNRQDEFFDLERLLQLVSDNLDALPEQLLATVFSTINAFGGSEKSDDKTSILLEIKDL